MVLQLTSCRDEFEAEVIKGALADMGIECILQGKHMSQIYGGIGAMSVNILVDEKDYDQARAYIDTLEGKEYEAEEETPATKTMSVKECIKNNFLSTLFIAVFMAVWHYFDGNTLKDTIGFGCFMFVGYNALLVMIEQMKKYFFRKK